MNVRQRKQKSAKVTPRRSVRDPDYFLSRLFGSIYPALPIVPQSIVVESGNETHLATQLIEWFVSEADLRHSELDLIHTTHTRFVAGLYELSRPPKRFAMVRIDSPEAVHDRTNSANWRNFLDSAYGMRHAYEQERPALNGHIYLFCAAPSIRRTHPSYFASFYTLATIPDDQIDRVFIQAFLTEEGERLLREFERTNDPQKYFWFDTHGMCGTIDLCDLHRYNNSILEWPFGLTRIDDMYLDMRRSVT